MPRFQGSTPFNLDTGRAVGPEHVLGGAQVEGKPEEGRSADVDVVVVRLQQRGRVTDAVVGRGACHTNAR